jgi:hypothetical protein
MVQIDQHRNFHFGQVVLDAHHSVTVLSIPEEERIKTATKSVMQN